MHQLLARVERLERDNRRLRVTTAALVVVLAGAAVLGTVWPQGVPEVLQAERFEVVDPADASVVGKFGIADPPATIELVLESETHSAAIQPAVISITGPGDADPSDGQDVASALKLADFERSIAFVNSMGMVVRPPSGSGAALYVLDPENNVRAQLGHTRLSTPATDTETTFPAAVVLYDAEGNVIWRAPR